MNIKGIISMYSSDMPDTIQLAADCNDTGCQDTSGCQDGMCQQEDGGCQGYGT